MKTDEKRDLAVGVLFEKIWILLFAFSKVHRDEFVGEAKFVEYDGYPASRDRGRGSVELEGHLEQRQLVP